MTIMFVDHHRNHPQEEKKMKRVCVMLDWDVFFREKKAKQEKTNIQHIGQ